MPLAADELAALADAALDAAAGCQAAELRVERIRSQTVRLHDAHPETTAEVGTETKSFVARVAEGDERTTIWEAHKKDNPGFADYEAGTTRQIPVVILEPKT